MEHLFHISYKITKNLINKIFIFNKENHNTQLYQDFIISLIH